MGAVFGAGTQFWERNVSFDGRGVWVKDGDSTIIGALFLQRCLLEANDAAAWKAVC